MMLLRRLQKLKYSTNLTKAESAKLFALSRTFCDKKDGELTTVRSDVELATFKRNKADCEVRAEEKKIIAEIHRDFKSEILVKIENGDNQVAPGEDKPSELAEKYNVKFDTRLDHFRRSGLIMKPTQGRPSKVIPQINTIETNTSDLTDRAIELIKPNDLVPGAEIFTENSDNRSLQHWPVSRHRSVQFWHEEPVEETTLGFPVVRPPHPMDRMKEGLKIRKSSSKDYPFVQEFGQHYDLVIIGGGLVGSMIAYFLTDRLEVRRGCKVAVVEKDLSYRRSLSTTSPLGLRMQHNLAETIEMSLYGSDFLRHLGRNLAIPFREIQDEDYFNVPNIKFQPNGHLTLASHGDMEKLATAHETQKMSGVQCALLTAKQIKKRFPWIKVHNIEGGCLGLESEGWYDSWNLLQAIKLKNKHQGVDYINGEVIYMKKHLVDSMSSKTIYMGYNYDGSKVPIGRVYEAHMLLPDSQQVYPLHFSNCILAGAGETGNLGRMCGIGDGHGPMAVEIPVERRRGYVFTVDTGGAGPGLNCPLTTDITGLYIRREGHAGQFSVGVIPDNNDDIPVNMFGDVHPDYWEHVVSPILKDRFDGFDNAILVDSYPVDYDVNYFDGAPIIGPHPYMGNMWMACGFGGYGGSLAPAAGRALTELIYDNGYHTLDLSRLSFDRVLLGRGVTENSNRMFKSQEPARNF